MSAREKLLQVATSSGSSSSSGGGNSNSNTNGGRAPSSLGAPSPGSRSASNGAGGGDVTNAQLSKQEAERLRKEQAAKTREELEMLRAKTARLEADNRRAAEEVDIWKNAQTAASAIHNEMEKVKAAHAKTKAELASQVAENAKLKREKAEMRDEVRRLRTLAANAERARTAPSIAAVSRQHLRHDGGDLQALVTTAQLQLVGCIKLQRLFRARRAARADASRGEKAAKLAAAAKARAAALGKSDAVAEAVADKAAAGVTKLKGTGGAARFLSRVGGGGGGGGGGVGVEGRAKPGRRELSKFEHGFTYQFRKVDAFYAGLEGYVGTPSPDIFNAMEREHKSEAKFSSHNVRNTSPRQEFLYVTRMEVGQLADRKADASAGRFGWQLDDFVQHDMARGAKLLREEVIALRLYTGPMYVHYNNRVLREAVRGEYVTTLHAINSGVVKLGRLQRATTVYRGVAGGVLPSSFFEPDEHGAVGGVEAAFMSTTTERSVALEYATRRGADGTARPSMLFHIKMGMIDRGASVSFLSQFPAENEILFAPLTGIEVVSRPWVEGTTVVVDVRLNCNFHDRTLEEVIGKMHQSHLSLIDLMYDDLLHSGAPPRALLSLTGLRKESAGRDSSEFNVAKHYRAATERVLAAQKDCMEALGEASSWESEADGPREVARKMMKIVTLQARAWQHDDATQLLFQALEKQPLEADIEKKMLAAERELDRKLAAERGQSAADAMASSQARGESKHRVLSEQDRKLLTAAVHLMSIGATPPWPPMIVSLLSAASDNCVRAFGLVLSSLDGRFAGKARPTSRRARR